MDIWDAATFEHLMAGGSFLPAQVASPCVWSPEKRLGGAVLASALVEIRDHHGDPKYRNAIVEDLRWIASDDDAPPFSFVRLCQTFGLEPEWVRDVVRRWMARAPAILVRRETSGRASQKRILHRGCVAVRAPMRALDGSSGGGAPAPSSCPHDAKVRSTG